MNRELTDPERLELAALCGSLADGTLETREKLRLNTLLRTGDEARQYYLRHAALSASLFSYAAEMQSEAPVPMPVRKRQIPRVAWWAAAAAVIILSGLVYWRQPQELGNLETLAAETGSVALMSGTKDCEWSGTAMAAGAPLKAGQKLELNKGTAEITFDSGARVTLDGPASLTVASAWDASLESGTLNATVPSEAAGFRVTNASVEVVDQGAEFSMIADASSAEVLVLKGSVEAALNGERQPVMLGANESRRFAKEGTSDVRDRERKFARFARVLKLDRSPSVGGYTHWSFDTSEGALLSAEVKGRKKAGVRTRMITDEKADAGTTLTEGRWGRSLGFDGRLFAKATVPGLAAPGEARTIAFWARVPETAPLTGGSVSMLGWGEKNRKREARHIVIGWNKHPAQGPVGALRTDLGQGVAMGGTSLRDGHWHHIAVVLVPAPDGRLQARQYLDGRLEGTASRPPPTRPGVETETTDTLWLGRGPGDRPKEAMFNGSLDELFIIDRPLSPAEIVRLMHDNQPPETAFAGAF
ncbi:MAG: Anti-FecI sigma factor, FecR [Verrucomicrobiaceae bacterium]|nr:Anti-FecI sigma factor, FecR [Verrucomicrobiaceae bacterium]